MRNADSVLTKLMIEYNDAMRKRQPEFWETLISAVEQCPGKSREEIARDGEERRKASERLAVRLECE